MAEYYRFVADSVNGPGSWHDLENHVYPGSEQFVERMQVLIDLARPLQEIPQRQRRPVAKPLHYYAVHRAEWDQAVVEAYRTGAYRMQAIAEHFGIGRMTVSRAVKRHETESLSHDVQRETWPRHGPGPARGPARARRRIDG